jgi:3-isopropylmalate dehydrogenase
MMLRYSVNYFEAADAIENAIEKYLELGFRTKDIARGGKFVSTDEVGELIVQNLEKKVNLATN